MCALVRVCMPDSALRNRQALHFIVFSGEAVRRGRLKIQHTVNTQLKKAPGNGNAPEGLCQKVQSQEMEARKNLRDTLTQMN